MRKKYASLYLSYPAKAVRWIQYHLTCWNVSLPAASLILTTVVNLSITSGVFPDNLKEAWVKHLLKKANLDLIDKNYRPVFNLEFQGKLTEWVVTRQLTDHIEKNKLMEPLQSAYCSNHSTETVLLKVKSEIINAMDNQQVICLVLLDISTAFDTVDHSIPLARLETFFGITGTALHWIKSCLTSRIQCVVMGYTKRNGSRSTTVTLIFSVPQGSVLGPILFTLYATPLSAICRHYNITFHLYANDKQVYLAFRPGTTGLQSACVIQLEECIGKIRSWMALNMLKPNDDKTELIIFRTRQQPAKISSIKIKIGTESITPTDFFRNRGVFLDKFLKGEQHISKISSQLYLQLKNIC